MPAGNDVREGELNLADNEPTDAENKQNEEQGGTTGQGASKNPNQTTYLGVKSTQWAQQDPHQNGTGEKRQNINKPEMGKPEQ